MPPSTGLGNASLALFPVTRLVWRNYIHLIPSQLELSYTVKNPSGKEHLLAGFLDDIESQYDIIIIDCAPTESVLTTAAYLSSASILIPVNIGRSEL
jgi:chromosome partitioning protein